MSPMMLQCKHCKVYHQPISMDMQVCGSLIFIPKLGWVDYNSKKVTAQRRQLIAVYMQEVSKCIKCGNEHNAYQRCWSDNTNRVVKKTVGHSDSSTALPVARKGDTTKIVLRDIYDLDEQEEPEIVPTVATKEILNSIVNKLDKINTCINASTV